MATNEETGQAGKPEGAGGKGRPGSIVTWLICAAILFAFYESIILLIVGMAPTFVAWLTDRSAQKARARTIGYLNFAGCVPWAVEYWIGGGDLDRVFDMVGDPYVLLVMYASAGVGWLLYMAVRPVVASYMAVTAEIKMAQLKKRQETLVEQWGADVSEQALASGLIAAPHEAEGSPESGPAA